jgi:zinc protease
MPEQVLVHDGPAVPAPVTEPQAANRVDRTRRPAPGRSRPFRVPAFESFELANGLRIHVAERHALPEVIMYFVLGAGAATEPPHQHGLADFTGRLLALGSDEHDAEAVSKRLDRLGAFMKVHVEYDVSTLSLHCLSDLAEEGWALLASLVRRPKFDPIDADRLREECLAERAQRARRIGTIADEAVARALYGAHRYGASVGGTAESIRRLDAWAAREFHQRHYLARGLTIVACGDLATLNFVHHVGATFDGCTLAVPGEALSVAAPRLARLPRRVVVVDCPGSRQAEIRIGAIGVPFGSPDMDALSVACAILGGVFTSRMNANLREAKGWTYGGRVSIAGRANAGPILARMAVSSDTAGAALEQLRAEIRRLREHPASEDELRLVRNALTLSFPIQAETNGQIARTFIEPLVYGLPADYWERRHARIAAITADDVIDVATRYLAEDSLTTVVAGDADVMWRSLSAIGDVERQDPV